MTCVHYSCVDIMNITLALDDRVVELTRLSAQAIGKSLNQAVRDYLEQLAGQHQVEAELAQFEQSALTTPGRLGGWTFDRDEVNAPGA
jgi:hypothetical protein